MDQGEERIRKNYEWMAKIARGEPTGVPAMDPRADAPQYQPYYARLREMLEALCSGFPEASEIPGMPEGAEWRMLKTLFLPEHVRLAVHVPVRGFGTAAEIARRAALPEGTVLEALLAMAGRGCIFHKREHGVDSFRHLGQIPGIIEFQPWRLSVEYREATGDYVSGYLRPVMFDLNVPSWRWIPINAEAVADNAILPYDNAERILLGAKCVSVCSCMCRAVQETPCKYMEPPYECCLQLDEFADFYVNDLKISRYITHDEIRALLRYNAEHHIAMEVAGSQRAEIICCCCECCCEPIRIFRKFGGKSVKQITNYVLECDLERCTGCGECAAHCFTREALRMVGGKPAYTREKCVGCGVCLRSCPAGALILRIKNPEAVFEPPESLYDLHAVQARGRGKG
ncbi:4Fe-4S binding protein [Solidesulfovibrio sp.]|uniref:4Fe-4S binding protein n=1 Tax=Solidesulfovibrio sp. TaxID=2910990 RepID=UPI002B1F035C|nr:4Fe-4S binding protein [Solidesulfovibrio sp.]MEA4858340.1 4Fe-4S binding protein [Solidesulfovibrio sp.]